MRARLVIAGLLVLSVSEPSRALAEPWTPVASRGVLRSAHSSARLASGKLLFAGGQYEPSLSLADLFDPKTLTFAEAAPMHEGRGYFCAVPLDGGKRVFVAGGTISQVAGGATTGARSTAEIYDEATNTWTLTKPMSVGRNNHACGLLPDGRVLVASGTSDPAPSLSTVEIYDPVSDTWTAAPPLSNELEAARAATLPGGDLLVVGGGFAFRWSTATSSWIAPGPTHTIPTRSRIGSLEDGRVLVVGVGTPVLYDGVEKTWTDLPAPKDPHLDASFAIIPGGKLLVSGGLAALTVGSPPLSTVEIFDGSTKTWTSAPPMLIGRATHTTDPIDPGRVIAVGAPVTSAEEVWNALPGVACTSDDQCGSGACTDGRCCDRTCNGPCEACNQPGKEGTCTAVSGAPTKGHSTCAPYLTCTAGACASSCGSDAECTSGNVCVLAVHRCGPARGLCDADGNVVAPSGQKTTCAPYVCGPSGDCLTACGTTLDCASGNVCDANSKTCVPATPKEPPSSSGGCATSLAPAGSIGFGVLLLLGLVLRRRKATVLSALVLVALPKSALADAWRPTRPMKQPTRLYLPVTRLADGRVLVAGSSPKEPSSAEIYDSTTDTWTPTKSPMNAPHSSQTSVLLPDGRVLIVGGGGLTGKPTDTVELFDPLTGTFHLGPKIPIARLFALAVILDDGRALIVGGVGVDSAGNFTGVKDVQIFDPKTSTWAAAGPLAHFHYPGGIARLPGGRVLAVGGVSGRETEIYDPASNAWTRGAPTRVAHEDANAIALADGRVVVVGASTVAEIYDPVANTWSDVVTNLEVRYNSTATQLPTGEILLVGGADAATTKLSDTTEILDPIAKKVRPGPKLAAPRHTHGAATVADGRPIIVGGLSTLDSNVPIFSLPLLFQLLDGSPCDADGECDSAFCTDGRCCTTRCKEACNACDIQGSVGTCKPIETGRPRKDHATCAPFGACIAGACASICASDDYCDDAHVCEIESGTCVEPKSTCEGDDAVDKSTQEHKSCAPYHCARGKCATRCATSDDCTGGAVCDQGVCGGAAPSTDSGGCSYGARAGSGAFAVLALALGLIRRRPSVATWLEH